MFGDSERNYRFSGDGEVYTKFSGLTSVRNKHRARHSLQFTHSAHVIHIYRLVVGSTTTLTRASTRRRLRRIVSTSNDPGDSTQTSRSRLLNAGKTLFAKNGYEQTSTAAIAREAGSSESQLIRYFGGKAGLLEAVFNDSWSSLASVLNEAVEGSQHGREAILRILGLFIQAFNRDHDVAFLFLFEGRRMRAGSQAVSLSKGFLHFLQIVDEQITRGQNDGSFRQDLDRRVLSSAMLGCAEGMVRDRVMAERNRVEHALTDASILQTFTAMVNGLAA